MNAKMDRTEWAMVLATGFFFGSSFVFIKVAVDNLPPITVAAGRTLDSRLTLRSEFYDNSDRLDLLNPRLRQLELRTSLRATRKGVTSGTEASCAEMLLAPTIVASNCGLSWYPTRCTCNSPVKTPIAVPIIAS